MLVGGAKQGFVTGNPHADGDFVTRDDGFAEAALHRLEAGWIASTETVQQRATGEPPRTEPVQDRLWKTAHGGEGRIRVQGIAVAGQPIRESLVNSRLISDGVIRLSSGEFQLVGWPSFSPETTFPATEEARAGLEQGFASLDVDRG